jgi:agmatine deiminase
VWLAWPSDADLWGDALAPAQDEQEAFCRAIAGERLELLVPDDAAEKLARSRLAGLDARFHRIAFGDIWLRDTAPIFVLRSGGDVAAACFRVNGWGGKYPLEHDDEVAERVAEAAGVPRVEHDFVLEGGAIEVDGEGTLLTSRQCLLNPNRNPELGLETIEALLNDALGSRKVLWVTEGLLEDHTDGHIDTIARFVAPGRVVCMAPAGPSDPNRSRLTRIAEELSEMTDALGRRLSVTRIPSPGRVVNGRGDLMPASYLNYYISNGSVAVPTYGSPNDSAAVDALQALFPGRRTLAVPARHILEGGGALHCISQQQPRADPS